jgi:hypothetical protein
MKRIRDVMPILSWLISNEEALKWKHELSSSQNSSGNDAGPFSEVLVYQDLDNQYFLLGRSRFKDLCISLKKSQLENDDER